MADPNQSQELLSRLRHAWQVLRGRDEPLQDSATPRAPPMQHRMYASARDSRLTSDYPASNASADAELVSSLTRLRSRSRALIRDVSYAKRAQGIVVNNVIGSGIGMQGQVMTNGGTLITRVNDSIENAWDEWIEAECCHTGGRLGFPTLERALVAQVFAAGEVFVRIHSRAFGRSRVPVALELIEAERVADEFFSPYITVYGGNHVRMGVECDEFYRPVAYHIRVRHPGEIRFSAAGPDAVERVPASEIIHLAVVDRWPQTRGEPWMHAAARALNDIAGYSEAEITRARVQAATPWTIETQEDAMSWGTPQPDGTYEMEVEPGVVKRLHPGEKMNAPSVSAPNPALDPFLRYMLREVAAGTGCSYESLSRDYSQSNYSSSRLALLDDRDLWKFFQTWFISSFRKPVHRLWLQRAVLARAIDAISIEAYAANPRKYEAALFKPRGWSWIDPTKEVEAFTQAVKQGFVTVSDVIAQTAGGQDLEDVLTTRERELEMMRERGLVFETSPELYARAPTAPGTAPADDKERTDDDDTEGPTDDNEGKAQSTERASTADEPTEPAARRVLRFRR